MKCSTDRKFFLEGLAVIVEIIQPSVIVVYGTANNKYFGKYKERGIQIVQFDSEFASSHKKGFQKLLFAFLLTQKCSVLHKDL